MDLRATAWLVQRFVDKAPKFIWLDSPKKCPAKALGYDFDGARFTHVGEKVTFEVVGGQDSYDGSTAHGVTSLDYGEWETSFTFVE